MKKIIVYCEVDSKDGNFDTTSYELLSKARELKLSAKFLANSAGAHVADSDYYVEAVALARELTQKSIVTAINSGADRVVLLKNINFENFIQTNMAKTFVKYYKTDPSDIILFPASVTGRIIAPRITTMLNTGLVADCTGLEFALRKDELRLAPTRPTFGAELMATILSKKNPQCATIRPHTFRADYIEVDEIKPGQYFENIVQLHQTEQRIKISNLMKDIVDNSVDFENAKIILAGGWGICAGKNKEYLKKLQKIAEHINASFAVTRKVVEAELADKAHQIGQTGATVTPDLYIAFGISGAIQHIQGMKNSKTIIAVNSDENADIFKYSDFKAVADAREVIDDMYAIITQ